MIRIGIICPSEIALRRFMPALEKYSEEFQFSAIGIASPEEWFGNLDEVSYEDITRQQERELEKAKVFTDKYGGKTIIGYDELVSSSDVDAVYVPLPPALHYNWARKALEHGKHVFVEKPSTIRAEDTDDLISLASNNGLALHENYMFIYHDQIRTIQDIVNNGGIGDIRLYRITFGFPLRQLNDFRYKKDFGGGAILDTAGYCLKYADYLLGGNSTITTATANMIEGFEVEMYGSATLQNNEGEVVQIAFGMDNDYRCEIEIWGSKGTLTSNRILTAPAGFIPTVTIKRNQEIETRHLPVDDAFLKSIARFARCINNSHSREEEYQLMHRQATLVEEFRQFIKPCE